MDTWCMPGPQGCIETTVVCGKLRRGCVRALGLDEGRDEVN